ncbi:N-acetyltransferase eco [Wyeomyia smithii]|uniref:N-acetyltransferase eco n=1 Tax=Wyeomyia smithii TaxID=174621 RepID=UPI002467E4D7|nr:N-acetyltransferase eco [Wyeomyia smithii]
MRKQTTFARNVESTGTAGSLTPQNGNSRITRSQHVPTPKMSTRKKALFCGGGQEINKTFLNQQEESDLGPMSPLKFSNSPKRTSTKALNITSFRNILGNVSPESDRSLSPDYERRFSHSERYEILSSYGKENNMSDEETRHSFPKEISCVRKAAENALLDETNSNSLSQLMNSDLNIVDKKSQIHKTPGLTEANSLNKEPKITFRKFSMLDNHSTPSESKNRKVPLGDMTNDCKARTSLTFNDLRPISTKSFYSSSGQDVSTKSQTVRSIQSLRPAVNVKTPAKRASSGHRRRPSAKPRGNSIRLGSFNRGVFHKIKKPVSKKANNSLKKLSTSQVLESTSSMLNSSVEKTVKKGSKSTPTSPLTKNKQPQQDPKIAQQMARIKRILQNMKNPIEQARPLSLSKSMTDLADCSLYSDERNECARSEKYADEEEDDSLDGRDDNDDAKSESGTTTGGGKFFKANSCQRIKREYKIFNNVSATVRKGGKISLNRGKERKRRFPSMFDEDFDFETEQLEVDDIISKLNQPPVNDSQVGSVPNPPPPANCSTSQAPEKMVEIEIVDAVNSEVSNDEPIPMQSNVIYVDAISPFNTASEESSSTGTEAPVCNTISAYHESPMTQIRTMTSELAITKAVNVSEQFQEAQPSQHNQQDNLFPIFHKDHQRTVQIRESTIEPSLGLFDPTRRRRKHAHNWRPIGANQYQIDAGQKEYGAQQCSGCGLIYSVHEPEEELIHENYHNSQHVLKFPGWTNEPVIARVPEWDVSGRILAVTIAESKQRLQKIFEVLSVVDRELGYIEPCSLMMGSVVYLAVARSTVLGVCVAQPVQQANRLLTIEGIEGSIDCCTMETYPTKCGISRIWVSPNFRCHGIARTILTVLKSHFIFGYPLSYDEIAFSAPTEAGKRLAESVTGRKDFLIYM